MKEPTKEPTLEEYKRLLQAKEAELGLAVKDRTGIIAQKEPDPLDQVQSAAEREMAISNLDRNTRALVQVREALFRLQNGSYGVCQNCEGTIGPRRLDAVPWAPFCIECQELSDRAASNGAGLEQEMTLA